MRVPFGQYRKPLLFLALLLAVVVLVVSWRTREETPGDYQVRKGNYRLEDGQYQQALSEFRQALARNPEHPMAHLGLAITLMQMGRNQEALVEFDRVIALAPELAVAYADKGILLDRLGRYREALAHYRRALALDAGLAEGPGWLWRFLRNIDRPPPTIRDRAAYLEAELAKPPEKRLLRLPEADRAQRMYKLE